MCVIPFLGSSRFASDAPPLVSDHAQRQYGSFSYIGERAHTYAEKNYMSSSLKKMLTKI